MLDGHLARHKFLAGGTLTIADFAAASPLFYAREGALPLEPHTHIRAWFERVSALPCWRQTAPQMAMAA
jgi:glutathione S-transferase